MHVTKLLRKRARALTLEVRGGLSLYPIRGQFTPA